MPRHPRPGRAQGPADRPGSAGRPERPRDRPVTGDPTPWDPPHQRVDAQEERRPCSDAGAQGLHPPPGHHSRKDAGWRGGSPGERRTSTENRAHETALAPMASPEGRRTMISECGRVFTYWQALHGQYASVHPQLLDNSPTELQVFAPLVMLAVRQPVNPPFGPSSLRRSASVALGPCGGRHRRHLLPRRTGGRGARAEAGLRIGVSKVRLDPRFPERRPPNEFDDDSSDQEASEEQ